MNKHIQECLLATAARSFIHRDVIKQLAALFFEKGVPVHIWSDHGPEFIAKKLTADDEATLFRTCKPAGQQAGLMENGFIGSINGKMRDKFLNGEIIYSLKEANVLLEQ